jgi:hypothetical protein
MHDGGPVVLRRSGSDSESLGDELRRQAFNQQIEDLTFALGEQRASTSDLLPLRFAVQNLVSPRESLFDRDEQGLGVNRLLNEVVCAGPHGGDRRRHVGVSSYFY